MANGTNSLTEDKLMIEEFKQAGSEYTFFQDLALKYLKFYTATVGIVTTAFLGISYHFSVKENLLPTPVTITSSTQEFNLVNINIPTPIQPSSNIVDFLKGPFLMICGLSIIIIGIITAFTMIKCRTKCIDSIKSMMRIRHWFYNQDGSGGTKRYSYYAKVTPRYYQLRSTTQGILIIIFFINAIAFIALLKRGIENISFSRYELIQIIGLAFIQYMVTFKYLMRKDIVKVRFKFNSGQDNKIKIAYLTRRSLTNNLPAHIIARILYWLIGLPEKGRILFLRRGEKYRKEVEIKENELWLIAGYYKIIAKGDKEKEISIISDVYGDQEDEITMGFDQNLVTEYGQIKAERVNVLESGKLNERVQFYMATRYMVYTIIPGIYALDNNFYSIFSLIQWGILPKFTIDFLKNIKRKNISDQAILQENNPINKTPPQVIKKS